MRFILVLAFILFVTACNNTEQKSSDTSKNASGETKEKPLAKNERVHNFSNSEKQDTFRITLWGNNLQTALAKFEIISSTGEVLYKEEFETNYFFDYNLQENATYQEKDEFILDRVETFFADENFIMPAIKSDQKYDPNYSDEKIWNAVKAEKGAIGFHYQLGKEDGRWLAYLKQQNKVVLYFNCC
jgi:hypothetical protein